SELRMSRLSWAIRSKIDWQTKMQNTEILERWRQEALEQQQGLPTEEKLTSNMINYVLSELEGYAKLSDPATGIQHACNESVFSSSRLVPKNLNDALRAEVAKLEDIPEDERDWHPGSNEQVLDLVHPSLHCVVYGRTLAIDASIPNQLKPLPAPKRRKKEKMFLSRRLAWLPSDFAVDHDSAVRLTSPYINNIHPSKKELYATLESILAAFIPMFERVLGSIDRMERPRIDGSFPRRRRNTNDSKPPVNLRGKTLQVIVKLANIHLTPEKPEYGGGSWHVEGMLNERIVSTGIYYYDSENISESHLAFRVSTTAPKYHTQDDFVCMEFLYGMKLNEGLVQERGSVHTSDGLALAFPNIYQHQVQPFRLLDPTKPGHRKILAFFLVDPNVRINSATNVPPQQKQWYREALDVPEAASGSGQVPRASAFTVEVKNMIVEHVDGLMTREEAEQYREELMQERRGFVNTYNTDVMEVRTFSMCEH
ncbi:hypothetical protein HETIRDRAFT_51381, partial [Heterobasidion irregulare TC 32-1]